MRLTFDKEIAAHYHSSAQIARLLTEDWVTKNMYCPRCGNSNLTHFNNNRPVADFFCPACKNEYELKSKNGVLSKKIADGAYDTMIQRITGNKNPDFFFMSYSKSELKVMDFILIPKHFFTPNIIEKRNPLSASARRSGWIGCNILIDKIPEQGRISIISKGKEENIRNVIQRIQVSDMLKVEAIESRGWLFDILNCVNHMPNQNFTLNDIYEYEPILKSKYPNNHNIKPKIRQQLQFLRDRGIIQFLGNGSYLKCTI